MTGAGGGEDLPRGGAEASAADGDVRGGDERRAATPEAALAAARAELAALRAAGRYAEPAEGLVVEPLDQVSRAQLLEWALLEPDMDKLRSTRRLGLPITALKRLQHRALRQYFNELTMRQTRFNIHALRKLMELEDRLERLESHAGPPAPARPQDAPARAGSGPAP